jgi:hypothetical protein
VWKDFVKEMSSNTNKLFKTLKQQILDEPEPEDKKQRDTRKQLRDQPDQRPEVYRLEVYRVER